MPSVIDQQSSTIAGDDPFSWLADGNQHVHALTLDRLLWRGFHERALPRLNALLDQGPPTERATAGWVIARWYAAQQNQLGAYRAILAFHAHPEGERIVRHPGPFLLGIQMCLACGDHTGATEILDKAIGNFGELPDFTLARLLLRKQSGACLEDISALLGKIHQPAGLATVDLLPGADHLFDRLHAEAPTLFLGPVENLPLVSIIVPMHNCEQTLPTALRGLQSQSWPRLEILLVDDGSQDDTLSIARAAQEQDTRIRVLALGDNCGAYPARNAGFAQSHGDFVTVHDADDWSHPQKIELQARALIADPSLKASISHWVRAGNELEMTRWRMEDSWIYRNVSSLMIRAVLRDVLGYWDRVKVNADTEYYYRILRAFGENAIGEVRPGIPLAFGRSLPDSLTQRGATHLRTQFRGVRRDYIEAAHHWHDQANNSNNLNVAQQPLRRPFRVPEAIALGDAEGQPSDYDLLASSSLLDEDWYLLAYPDVLHSDVGAVRHFLAIGAREDRDPGPLFSTAGYRLAHGLSVEENPLPHFLREGQERSLSRLPTFPTTSAPRAISEARRVLVFAHTSAVTLFGAERSLLDVVRRIVRDGLRPIVVLPSVGNLNYLEALHEIGAHVETLPQAWRNALHPPNKDTISAARALIRKYRPYEVHVNTIMLEAPLVAAKAEGVPSVVYVRELPAADKALCRALGMGPNNIRRQILQQADRFIMPSDAVAQWLACPDRCKVRPNAVDEELFELPFEPEQVLRVALISSNVAKKGIADLVSAATRVADRGVPVHFLLIGPSTPDVQGLGILPPNVLRREYTATPLEAVTQTDLVLSLSHFAESFGRTVVEAMAAGRPVVCYDRGAPPTLVIDGKTGFVVPPDSPKDVAEAILSLSADRVRLAQMSKAARLRARAIQHQATA